MRLVSFMAMFFLSFPLFLSGCGTPPSALDMSAPGAGMVRLGNLMREKGDIGGAMDFYNRALLEDPNNLSALKGLGDVLEAWGDKNAAKDVYERGVEAHPQDGDLRRAYAKMLLGAGDPLGAKAHYKKALVINDRDERARSGYGVALDYLGKHKDAQKQYAVILKSNPRNLSALNNLAYSHILMRHYNKAIQLLEPEVNNPSATAALRQNLALAYGLAGMDIDAQRVASMDLPSQKIPEVMDYYRRQRLEIGLSAAPYAELGSYATEGLALAQIEKLRSKASSVDGSFKPVIVPEVSAPGGTPRFAVRMMGCSRPDDISNLCAVLGKAGIPCTAKGLGAP